MQTKPDEAAKSHQTLMSVRDLEVHFELGGNALARLFGRSTGTVKAVDGVSLDIAKGEVLGLVGESGSGKTTLGRALLGLVRPTAGHLAYGEHDLTGYSERQLRGVRTDLQMVFQDPNAALNPAMTIEASIAHPLTIHKLAAGAEVRRRVIDALERVGLSPVERFLGKYPSDLSGGQKQRAVIARAIIMDPKLLVADEPISMLDMSVRAKILQLMLDLRRDLDLTYVYITHDLASAKFFCDRIGIMYLGRVVEIGRTDEIFANPRHPYTKALLKAIPEPDPHRSLPRDLPQGEIPDAAQPPLGCSFHPRCPVAFDRCGWEPRDLQAVFERHWLSLSVEEYQRERALVRNFDDLESAQGDAVLHPGSGRSTEDIEMLIDKLRSDQPDSPFWAGVRSVERNGSAVTVSFTEGEDPGLRPDDDVQVACHLF